MRGAAAGTAIAPFLGPLGPVAPVVGGMAGAVLGGTSGRLAGRGLTTVTGLQPPPSADEVIRHVQAAVPENLAGEGLGQFLRGGLAVGGLAKRRFLRGADPTPEQLATFDDAARHDITIRPADLTENVAATRVERTLRATQGGSDIFRRTDLQNRKAMEAMLTNDMAQQSAAMTPSQRGELIQSVLEGKQIPQYQKIARQNYDELRHITAGDKMVLPKESFALVQNLEQSVSAQTHPKVAGLIAQIKDQLGQPGQVTGLSVSKRSTELPGTERLTGLNVRQTSRIEPPPAVTGLTVKGRYGPPAADAPAAEAPLLGLQVRRKSEQALPDMTTGLKVSPRYEQRPGDTALTGLTVDTQSRAPLRPRPLGFSEAHTIRSLLGELGSTGETLPGRTQGIANNLWKMLGHEMEQGARTFQLKTGVPLVNKWR